MNSAEILKKFTRVAVRKLETTTENSYLTWIRSYLGFLKTPAARAEPSSEAKFELFLSDMARDDYSESSQHQAFCAILFLYRHVFEVALKDLGDVEDFDLELTGFDSTELDRMLADDSDADDIAED